MDPLFPREISTCARVLRAPSLRACCYHHKEGDGTQYRQWPLAPTHTGREDFAPSPCKSSHPSGAEQEYREMALTEVEHGRQKAFAQLKPLCVRILQPAVFTTIRRDETNPLISLSKQLKSIGASDNGSQILEAVFDYVCFPLMQLFKYPSPSTIAVEGALDCILCLLQNTREDFMPLALYRDLLVALPYLISRGRIGKSAKEAETTPEELKQLGVQCLAQMLRRVTVPTDAMDAKFLADAAETSTTKYLCKPEYQPTLAHVVVVLVDIIDKERHTDLRLAALAVISELVKKVYDADHVAQFLPGVSSTLVKVCLRDEKQSHRIIVASLAAFADIIRHTMNNEDCRDLIPRKQIGWTDLVSIAEKTSELPLKEEGAVAFAMPSPPQRGITTKRDIAWFNASSTRLTTLITNLFTIRHHDHYKVRQAFITLSADIITHSGQSLATSIPILVETLVGYVNDTVPQVSNEAKHKLDTAASTLYHQSTLVTMLKRNFYSMLESLPRLIMQADDRKKLEALNIVNGYVVLLKTEIRPSLNAAIHRWSIGVLRVATMETADVRLVEDRGKGYELDRLAAGDESPASETGASTQLKARAESLHFPRKHFLYFRDDRVEAALSQMCRLIGRYGDMAFLASHFLNHIKSEGIEDFQAQATFVLNEMLLGAAGSGIDQMSSEDIGNIGKHASQAIKSIAKSVTQDLLQCSTWTHPTNLTNQTFRQTLTSTSTSTPTHQGSITHFNTTILKQTLLLESLATTSHILGPDMQVLLMDTLYTLLSKIGDSNRVVSHTAMTALHSIALSQSYPRTPPYTHIPNGAVIELILDNIDYIVNAVSRHLRYLSTNPDAPVVLRAAIRTAGVGIVPYMADSVEEVLDAVDAWYLRSEGMVQALVGVLDALVEVMDDGGVDVVGESDEQRDVGTGLKGLDAARESVSDNPEFKGCSREMIEFYLEFAPSAESKPGNSDDTDEPLTRAAAAEKFFKDRAEGLNPFTGESTTPPSQNPPRPPHPPPATPSDPTPPPLPPHQQLTLLILPKLPPLLTHPSPTLRHAALTLLQRSLRILRPTTHLNTTIHTFWPIVVKRMSDTEHWVATEAMRCVGLIAALAGGFVAKRVGEDIVPRYAKMMGASEAVGGQHNNNPTAAHRRHEGTTHSPRHRLHLTALRTVRSLVPHVALPASAIRTLVDATLPFLNATAYHAEVVHAATALLTTLASDPAAADAVYLPLCACLGARGVRLCGGQREHAVPGWMVEKWRAKGGCEAFLEAGVQVLRAVDGEAWEVTEGWVKGGEGRVQVFR
ncbi:uncharacterized protein EV422DRAFT_579829 [Fimicolochytrium jonesii]|uniref:uncharacterized protein n=1 Tax=Fimicolochytrium jonesii TaxID=1396493 RepID=UPI0022FF1ABF|nr:uncharacterized protein EV422DRAFT_579829 [Fimicolochytrium jonesii]KAI8818748.1 hypothetical protein EV422DRAFT_579829 [Fimicolochytrium jonesii]